MVIVMMAVRARVVVCSKLGDEHKQRLSLLRRARVSGLAVSHATYVCNADAVSIMSATVRTRLAYWSASLYSAVEPDDIVVADIAPSTASWRRRRVPLLDVSEGVVLSSLGGSAVYDYSVYVAHGE